MIKFVSLSEFIRYRAIKVPPFNYFNTLRGAWSDFYGPSGPAIWAIWAELSSEIVTTWAELSWADFFMGRVVLGRLVFGPSCPEPMQPFPTQKMLLIYLFNIWKMSFDRIGKSCFSVCNNDMLTVGYEFPPLPPHPPPPPPPLHTDHVMPDPDFFSQCFSS